MDDVLLAAYRASAYRVRLAGGGWATIRIDAPLPEALTPHVGRHPWAFITAWNPCSQPLPRSINRRSQHALLEALRALAATVAVRPGCGVGVDGWHEPSLFVVGPDPGEMDMLAHRYGQNAYVHGHGDQPARLRRLR